MEIWSELGVGNHEVLKGAFQALFGCLKDAIRFSSVIYDAERTFGGHAFASQSSVIFDPAHSYCQAGKMFSCSIVPIP